MALFGNKKDDDKAGDTGVPVGDSVASPGLGATPTSPTAGADSVAPVVGGSDSPMAGLPVSGNAPSSPGSVGLPSDDKPTDGPVSSGSGLKAAMNAGASGSPVQPGVTPKKDDGLGGMPEPKAGFPPTVGEEPTLKEVMAALKRIEDKLADLASK